MSWNNISFQYGGAEVLVTGGTGGIGNAIAAAYRDAGARVTVTGTRGSATEYDVDLEGYTFRQLNVENKQSIESLANDIDQLDVLVNSAGLAFFLLGLDEYDPDVFDRAIMMHLSSVHRLSALCAPKLSKSKLGSGGSIISMASMSSIFGIDAVPGYGAAKTGLLGMTRVLAVHWASKNVRVNALAVGMTKSGMTEAVMSDPDINTMMLARVPMGRHGEPEDLAGATLFLTSDAASWITGQTIAVDGGFSIAG